MFIQVCINLFYCYYTYYFYLRIVKSLIFLSSTDIIRESKRRRTRCAGLAERMGSVKYAYKLLTAKLKRKIRLRKFWKFKREFLSTQF
jgi:hypothetical protein